MSSHKIVPTIRRVLAGERTTRPVSAAGFASGEVPANGFVVSFDGPHSIPLFIRDEDIESAKAVREEKDRSVAVKAISWGDEDE